MSSQGPSDPSASPRPPPLVGLGLKGQASISPPGPSPKGEPKKRIGEYDLGKVLGEGSYSKVRQGLDVTTGVNYAVKIIDKKQLALEQMQDQLRREIAILKLLNHENVVHMHEVLQTTKTIYIILELVNGCELHDLLPAIRWSEHEARWYFQQLIMGLRYCHYNNVAHRDLKPENILVDRQTKRLLISDFGLANMQPSVNGQGTLLKTVCGTPNYVAPEVLKEQGYDGFRADLWSAGVILYVMITGSLPFEDKNTTNLYLKIEKGEYRIPRAVSDGARDLIMRLLVVDPKQRYTISDVMKHPWFRENFDGSRVVDLGVVVQASESEVTSAIGNIADDQASPSSLPLIGFGSPRGLMLEPTLAQQMQQQLQLQQAQTATAASSAVASPETASLESSLDSRDKTTLPPLNDDGFSLIQRMSFAQVVNFVTPPACCNFTEKNTVRYILMSGGTALDCFRRLSLAVDDISRPSTTAGKKVVKSKEFEIRGFKNANNSLFQFVLVMSGTASSTIHMVEVRLLRGPLKELDAFAADLRSAIDHRKVLENP